MSSDIKKRQTFEIIKPSQLLDKVKALKEDGYIFYQACAAETVSGAELLYSFDKADQNVNLKISASKRSKVESISFIYPVAAVYEEDIETGFGVDIKHIDTEGRMRFAGADIASRKEKARLLRISELLKSKDSEQMVYVMERMEGKSSFGASLGFCRAVEAAMSLNIPARAEYLRVILLELSRIQAHLAWLARLAQSMSLDSLAMGCLKVREQALNVSEKLTGGRIIYADCKIGGMKKDIENEKLADAAEELVLLRDDFQKLADVFLEDRMVKKNLIGLNSFSKEDARRFHAVGIWAKASGIAEDSRSGCNDAYYALGFSPVVETEGDCLARLKVRIGEIMQSVDLICGAVELMPDGEISSENVVKGYDGIVEAAVKTELPDGEALFYVRGSKKGSIKNVTVRMPSYVNNFALAEFLRGKDGTADELF